jgi:hypothetical protein
MSDDTLLPFDLPSVRRKKLTVDFDGGNQSSDDGLLLLREAERRLGVCARLAAAMPDRRDASRIEHEMLEIPPTNPLATAEFATLRERLIKIGARVIEQIARIRIQLPTSCPEGALFRTVALGLMPSGP